MTDQLESPSVWAERLMLRSQLAAALRTAMFPAISENLPLNIDEVLARIWIGVRGLADPEALPEAVAHDLIDALLRDLNVFGTDEQAAWARGYADRYAAPARRIGALLAMLGQPDPRRAEPGARLSGGSTGHHPVAWRPGHRSAHGGVS